MVSNRHATDTTEKKTELFMIPWERKNAIRSKRLKNLSSFEEKRERSQEGIKAGPGRG